MAIPGCLKQGGAPTASLLLAGLAAALLVLISLRSIQSDVRGSAALHSPRQLAAGEGAERQGLAPAAADGGAAAELAALQTLLDGWPAGKPRACLVVLARNSDLQGVLSSVRQLERRFNGAAGYPWMWVCWAAWARVGCFPGDGNCRLRLHPCVWGMHKVQHMLCGVAVIVKGRGDRLRNRGVSPRFLPASCAGTPAVAASIEAAGACKPSPPSALPTCFAPTLALPTIGWPAAHALGPCASRLPHPAATLMTGRSRPSSSARWPPPTPRLPSSAWCRANTGAPAV